MHSEIKQGDHVLLKVMLFSIGLILVFTLVANLLPQVEGEAPVDKEVDLTTLTMASFIALGENIFLGKGTCTLCHNNMGRAPDLLALNSEDFTKKALADSRYKGTAKDSAEYIHESMLTPGVYVVKGYGKKGSHDTVSPMPAIDKVPIQLSTLEMDAVTAFLQAKDGNDVTVALPTSVPVVAEKKPQVMAAKTAEEALDKYTCTACHAILNSQSLLGPDLKAVGKRLSPAQIRQSIIEPNAVIAKGYQAMMPVDFADKMTVRELEMIVTFLVNSKG